MSDSFQSIAFPEVQMADAEDVASHIRQELISRGIIGAEPSPKFALDDVGYAPGEDFASALADPSAGAQLHALETNGVVFPAEPTVFSGSEPPEATICPMCSHRFDGGEDFVELVGEWFEGERPALDCPGCGEASPLEQIETSPPWALAHVGVKFWNWPILSEEFLSSLAAVVGSKAVLVTGKV